MFDLFVLRETAQRRVKAQFEAEAKARADVGDAAPKRRSRLRAASAPVLRLLDPAHAMSSNGR